MCGLSSRDQEQDAFSSFIFDPLLAAITPRHIVTPHRSRSVCPVGGVLCVSLVYVFILAHLWGEEANILHLAVAAQFLKHVEGTD